MPVGSAVPCGGTVPDPLICLCARVPESELIQAALRWPGDPVAVGEATGAGSGCGDCMEEVEEIAALSMAGDIAGQGEGAGCRT
ncbi:(2Fe-2S)-binding protein [Streptomyces sp. NPDC091287]|uniref:(2Fe-2S)-binding protein n=1 Tax=Streptomyces sp. NPDC091287 TaxID=3365988 RepID=UPI00380FC020